MKELKKDYNGLLGFVIAEAVADTKNLYKDIEERVLSILNNSNVEMLQAVTGHDLQWLLDEMERQKEFYETIGEKEIEEMSIENKTNEAVIERMNGMKKIQIILTLKDDSVMNLQKQRWTTKTSLRTFQKE